MATATKSRNWKIFLVVSFLLGAALRLSFSNEIEFKYDEKYMFERSQLVGVSEAWPTLGMASGAAVRNPALSIWVFVALARLTGAHDPVALARAVQGLNLLAILAMMAFAWFWIEENERSAWFWAAALVCVNPLEVLFHRKIWAQCVLPVFCIFALIAFYRRERRGGAFFWGMLGAWLGQIHMSGFFIAAGLFAWTLFFERRLETRVAPAPRTRWPFWVLGSLMGSVPLVPWLQYLLSGSRAEHPPHLPWNEILQLRYWNYWMADPFGDTLAYSLGTSQFRDFLRYPLIGGMPSYLAGAAHVATYIVMILLVVQLARWLPTLFRERGRALGRAFFGLSSETAFMQSAEMWGGGLLMTSAAILIHRHYLIVSFPLEFIWLARLIQNRFADTRLSPRALLGLLWVSELCLSALFLWYIHQNHGAWTGDYWVGYAWQ